MIDIQLLRKDPQQVARRLAARGAAAFDAEAFQRLRACYPHRRLYVGRGQTRNNRRVENEAELLSALEDRGFTKFDPAGLTVAEQVRTFAEASVIVAAHGAALTNVAFCSPATDVVELFAPDYVNPCYWALARRVPGVRYHYVLGRGREPRRNSSMLGVSSDIRMDVTKVLKTLDGVDA